MHEVYSQPVSSVLSTAAGVTGATVGLLPQNYRNKAIFLSTSLQDGARIAISIENLVPYFTTTGLQDMQDLKIMLDCIGNKNFHCMRYNCLERNSCIAQTLRKIALTMQPLSHNIVGKVVALQKDGKAVYTIQPGFLMTIASSALVPAGKRIDLSKYAVAFTKIYDILEHLAQLFESPGIIDKDSNN